MLLLPVTQLGVVQTFSSVQESVHPTLVPLVGLLSLAAVKNCDMFVCVYTYVRMSVYLRVNVSVCVYSSRQAVIIKQWKPLSYTIKY